MRRTNYLNPGTCETPLCGGIEGYFCVRCRHYVTTCLCGVNNGGCVCSDDKGWAGAGERKMIRARLAETEPSIYPDTVSHARAGLPDEAGASIYPDTWAKGRQR